jgi:hypothetical protein
MGDMVMGLSTEEREMIENSIYDAHFAAGKYIESGKDIHYKLLEVSVNEALQSIELLKSAVQEDEMSQNYKIHLLVPLQLLKLVEGRRDK